MKKGLDMIFTDIEATNAFLRENFTGQDSDRPRVTEMREGFAAIELVTGQSHQRPGNMVSGPTQMALADTVAYICVFTQLGITPMAVTSSLNMSFLRPCVGPTVRAEATMVKLGRTLAVTDVRIFGVNMREPSAISTVTYALPK